MRCAPQRLCRVQRIDIQLDPPYAFVTAPVQLAVMRSTQRHREFVADLLCQSARLRKTQVVGVAGLAGADEAGLFRNEPQVLLVS